MNKNFEKATFAGGCFWCMVKPFDQWDGIKEVVSGYTGGTLENPTYEDVKAGNSGHYEAVQITYQPEIISYKEIVDIFWKQIDPTDAGGQFHDRGDSYRTAIFYHTAEQKKIAESTKKELEESGRFNRPIVTEILPADVFYPAEDYHQDYYKKEKAAYEKDRAISGRDDFLQQVWE
ncbi:peptide-methionine (S)-S-oxide reductase MsrA [Virgibacillus sp. W0430]|uniref:peptide-methionine (S)-S-oxide reductase MsrA n=1 Tax=Virgibacillus sp. W0430 TaxID=3391580 RepID=UPI003F486B9A